MIKYILRYSRSLLRSLFFLIFLCDLFGYLSYPSVIGVLFSRNAKARRSRFTRASGMCRKMFELQLLAGVWQKDAISRYCRVDFYGETRQI